MAHSLSAHSRPAGAIKLDAGAASSRPSCPSRRIVRVAAQASASKATPDVPVDDLPPAHARAAVAAANRRARAMASAEAAAETLGDFLGLGKGGLSPGATANLDREQVLGVLEAVWRRGDLNLERALYSHANAVTNKYCGGGVYYRGLVEFSNICQNDCSYCGIRNNQKEVWRYTMPVGEVVEVAKWALENGIRNIMLQGGELKTEQRLAYLEACVRAIREETTQLDLEMRARAASTTTAEAAAAAQADPEAKKGELELGVVVSLSVGELPMEQYERLFRAGARRYLIRIETSNPDLYTALHPEPMSWHARVECLRNLKKAGYMLGTGVMVGLPGQTLHDLAGDVMFFRDIKADMIGMGPFITQPGTPATDKWTALYPNANKNSHMKSMFDLTTAMNALVRITMGNVNISATTALQAIIPTGREIALERGANVVMPILTPTQYRESYQLYEGKPCITDTAVQCRRCLDMRLHSVGKTSAAGVWGDPASFLHPIVGVPVPHDLSSPALAAAASADFHESGAGPWNPIRLERLVEVPDRYPDPDNHGRKKAGKGGKAHDSHDDGDDDHHHGAAPAGAAAGKGTGAAAIAGGAGASRQRVAGAAATSARLCTGARRAGCVVASPLRPAAACRGVAVKAAAAAAAGEGAGAGAGAGASGAGSNIVASPGIASTTANGVPRINIGVFGVMNAGKSTLVNALAQQEACIVDSTPGTTADVKTVLLELHALGPAKLLDTAGLDEVGGLGDKKRRKALNTLKECDVAVLVVDTDTAAAAIKSGRLAEALEWESRVMEQAHKYNVSPVLLLNVKSRGLPEAQAASMLEAVAGVLDPSKQIPRMSLDLASTPLHERSTITSAFVKQGAVRSSRYGAPLPGCLPRWSLGRNAMLLMVIPMDAETPGGRLLRPQAQVMEEAIRHWATVLSVRLDLDAARGKLGPEAREMERQRFGGVIDMLERNDGPTLVVTDSQAIDVVHPWTLDRTSGRPLVPITTFSIAMAFQQNGGRLDPFVEGLEALETLQDGDRVLISEACNHNRITSACNDIGMVQIPNKLAAALGGKKLQIEHAFGREFPELESGGMDGLKLAIHCGGCMIDPQKMQQRMKDLHEAGVPVTNYGVFFSWAAWPDALRRALEPWGVEPPLGTPATPAAAPATAASGV